MTRYFRIVSCLGVEKGVVCTPGQYKMAVRAARRVSFTSGLFYFLSLYFARTSACVTLRNRWWFLLSVSESRCIFCVWTSSVCPTSTYLALFRRDSSVCLDPDLWPDPGKLHFMTNQTLFFFFTNRVFSPIKASRSSIFPIISFCSPTSLSLLESTRVCGGLNAPYCR